MLKSRTTRCGGRKLSQCNDQALRIESVSCSKNIHRPSFFSSAGISSTEIHRYSSNFQSKFCAYVLAYTLRFEQVYPSFQFAGEALSRFKRVQLERTNWSGRSPKTMACERYC